MSAGWETGAVVADVYEIGERIGEDDTGVWDRVWHRGWRREMAVKSPPAEPSGDSAGALLDEGRVWLEMPPHPHLLGCHFVRVVAGAPRVFAEYAPGGTLADALREGRYTEVGEILDVGVQLAWGLDALHAANLVHGDVRASGVVLGADGTAKLSGFGSRGGEPSDDVRAWARVLLEMFTGHRDLDEAVRLPDGVTALLRACLDADRAVFSTATERLVAVYEREAGRPYPRQGVGSVAVHADGWNNRALSMLALGAEDQAETCWERALHEDPRHPDAVFNLGLRQWRAAQITDDELLRRLETVRQANAGIAETASHIPYLTGLVHLERGDGADPPLTRDCASGWMFTVAVSPDGRRVVWGAEDGALRRWDVGGKGKVTTLTGHDREIWSTVVTPDGRHALSTGTDRTVRWWDLDSRRCLRVLTGHTARVRGVAVTADGRRAVSGAEDGAVRVWDLRGGRCLRVLTGDTAVHAVATTQDGRRALVGGGRGMLRLWDLETGQCLSELTGHTDTVHSVAMTEDGRYALTGGADSEVRWWDLDSGRCLRVLIAHTATVFEVAVTPDGRLAVTGGTDRTMRCWDLATGRCLQTFPHDFLVLSVTVSPDGRRVISSASDRTVRLWTLPERRPAPWSFSRPADAADLAAHAREFRSRLDEARDLLTAGESADAAERLRLARAVPGHARHPALADLWEEAGRNGQRTTFLDIRRIRTLECPSGVTGAAIAPDGRHALSAGCDNTLRWWDLTTGECLRVMEGHTDTVMSVAVAADGRTAVSASADHTLRHWDLTTGECLRTLSGHAEGVAAVALAGDHAASAGDDHMLRWWDLRTGDCLRVLEGHSEAVLSVSVTPDGRSAVSGGADGTLRWWDLATGACRKSLSGHQCGVRSVAVASDGRHAMAGETCGVIDWWSLEDGRSRLHLTGQAASLTDAALTSDAGHVLAGSLDGSLRWWDLSAGRCQRVITGHADEVCAVAITPDAHRALTGSRDGTISVWALDWDYDHSPER